MHVIADVHDFNQVIYVLRFCVLLAADVALNRALKGLNLFDFLLEHLLVFKWIVRDLNFVPFLADPALRRIRPVGTLFDIIMTEDP